MNRFLPRKPFALECPEPPRDAAIRLAHELAKPPEIPIPQYRVRGESKPEGVHLWYSLTRRAKPLAPQLHATWEANGTGSRIVGEFRQNARAATLTLVSAAAMTVLLVLFALRHEMPWSYAIVGSALFLGFAHISWFISGNHVEKIEEFVRQTLAARADGTGGEG